MVRVNTPPADDTLYHLAAKFGAAPDDAAALMQEASRQGCAVGLAFHVGSQCRSPEAYVAALDLLGEVIAKAGVQTSRSEERRVGKAVVTRVDLGVRRHIKKKQNN